MKNSTLDIYYHGLKGTEIETADLPALHRKLFQSCEFFPSAMQILRAVRPTEDEISRKRSEHARAETQALLNAPRTWDAIPDSVKPMIEKLTGKRL